MPSTSLLENGRERKMNVEVASFSSFLTEDMLDAAMNNIQDNIEDFDNEDEVYIDDETSGVSSNDSVEVDVMTEGNLDGRQQFNEKINILDLNESVIAHNESKNLKNILNDSLYVNDTTKMEDKSDDLDKQRNEGTLGTEKFLSENIDSPKDKGSTNMSLSKDDSLLFSDKEKCVCTEIILSHDAKNQIVSTEKCTNTDMTLKMDCINCCTLEKRGEINTEIIVTNDSDKQLTNKESRINTEITLKEDDQLESLEERIIKRITLPVNEEKKITEDLPDATTVLSGAKLNIQDTKNYKISSVKEAVMKDNKICEKTVIETGNHIDALKVVDSTEQSTPKENKTKEKAIIKVADNQITLNGNAGFKIPELKIVTNSINEKDTLVTNSINEKDTLVTNSINEKDTLVTNSINEKETFYEKIQPDLVCKNVENSLEVERNYEEMMMDYEEISDDDDCGLQIDDNLEKEIENNLMAEIGLSPQAKKACFVLDDPEIVDDVERDNESITLYKAEDTETTDASSMVECILDNSSKDINSSPLSTKHLMPSTSYSGSPQQTTKKSKQVKMFYIKDNKKPHVVKQMIPVLEKPVNQNQNKNVQYVLRLNGNIAVDNVPKKKFKLVPVHKSILTPASSSSNKVVIKNPTFDEAVLKEQIIANQLPPYACSNVGTSSTVFRCEECQDTFLVQSSLKHHLTRRSVIITYWCRICCISIKFYNRCVMLKHIRLHKQSVSSIDPTSVELRPLSKEMVETGLPKSITQGWEENSVKNIASKFSTTNSFVEKTTTVANAPKTLTSVVKIPRTNINRLANSSKNTRLGVTVNDGKINQVQGNASETNNDVDVQNNSDKSICTNDDDLDTTENNQINFDNFQTDETLSEIRIDEVYSMNIQNVNTDEEEINSVVAENITDFKSLLSRKTKKIPRLSVKALPLVENDLPTDCKVITLPNKNGTVRSSKVDSQNKFVKFKNDKKDNYTYCSECGIKVIDMERHLNRTNIPTDPNLSCKVCRLILPTKCALKIHLRVHMKLPPYKCPECGKQFSVFENLYPHLKYVCGHLSRHVKYICSKCKKPCSNLVQLESHIFSLHTDSVFKCNMCPVAFFNLSSVKKHRNKVHTDSNISPIPYQQCSLCPDLIPKGKVSEHISEHARNPSQVTYAYQCPGCKKWYTNKKSAYVSHLAVCVKVTQEFQKFKNEITASNKNKDGDVNDNYSEDSDSVNEEPTIVRAYHLDEDIIEVSEKDPLSLEDWEGNLEQHVVEKRIEKCIVCKEEPVIILPGTNLNTQSLCCKLCVKPVNVENHQNKKPSNQFKDKTINFKTKTDLTKSKSNNGPFKRTRSSRPIKRKVNYDFEYDTNEGSFVSEKSDSTCSSPENKKLPKNKIRFKKTKVDSSPEISRINFISGQIIPENQSDNVLCSKCGFKADNVNEFRNHVITHRTDPNAYQCLECGLCFVVRPSLEKHLIVLHRIKNVEEYVQNNDVGGGYTVKEEQEEGTDSVKDNIQENQCRVCYVMFDSPNSLDKHFRTHGMAFLMSSQRQSRKL